MSKKALMYTFHTAKTTFHANGVEFVLSLVEYEIEGVCVSKNLNLIRRYTDGRY